MSARQRAVKTDPVIFDLLCQVLDKQDALVALLDDTRTAAWFARRAGLSPTTILRLIESAAWLDGTIPEFTATHSRGGRVTWQVSAKAFKDWYTRERMAALRAMSRQPSGA